MTDQLVLYINNNVEYIVITNSQSYSSRRQTLQFLFPISIKWCYTEFKCLSLAYVSNRLLIYKIQGPNPTGNISLMLNSKRMLNVLMLCILLSNKKSLKMVHMQKMELGIRNWNSSAGSLIGIFKCTIICGRNKK